MFCIEMLSDVSFEKKSLSQWAESTWGLQIEDLQKGNLIH